MDHAYEEHHTSTVVPLENADGSSLAHVTQFRVIRQNDQGLFYASYSS